jgi:hypothetical protein
MLIDWHGQHFQFANDYRGTHLSRKAWGREINSTDASTKIYTVVFN